MGESDHFDLLPFIAILMCVLGCLLLVTMSVAALSIGPGVGEGWIPAHEADTTRKIPILIEWDGTTATIHRNGRKVRANWSQPPARVISIAGNSYQLLAQTDEKGFHPALLSLVQELSERKSTHYALFALRPSGFENFYRFAEEFRTRQIDIGYEPIDQHKQVRLVREPNQ